VGSGGVTKKKTKLLIVFAAAAFIVYALFAAEPIPVETVLQLKWLNSFDSIYPESDNLESTFSGAQLFPVDFAGRFGYTDGEGRFSLLRKKDGIIATGSSRWAEFSDNGAVINVYTPLLQKQLSLNSGDDDTNADSTFGGYPLLFDGMETGVYIISPEQNSISRYDEDGARLWYYDFAAPVTCVDWKAGVLACGLLDGSVELVSDDGSRLFFFEPGASRIAVITGCALNADATKLALISGIDYQRFILLEKFQESYRVVHHEFLDEGFRRPVLVRFIANGSRVVFERKDALELYDIASRARSIIPLNGSLVALTESKGSFLFFVVDIGGSEKELVILKYPADILTVAPFTSRDVYIFASGNNIFLGGGTVLAKFELEQE
jgi:hypothetical protein